MYTLYKGGSYMERRNSYPGQWEIEAEERREHKWLTDLEDAIESHNEKEVKKLMEVGLTYAYTFPKFQKGTWESNLFEEARREN